ncbi:hypothetical protein [Mariluticola halotolerans]|uniref:hypothetical protein n=1 Tax=Mariluticola halotolerans TaxID=2909283 RepID=UPI0026E3B051|nr:hypothetical protein [Mariluticola halotolerans]UJQ93033.1 hypothetical protein L1P08_08380 [Mariluticola halotolerans]
MSDMPQVLNTLHTKADKIAAHIASLEAEIDQARMALAHVNATIVLFEAPDAQSRQPALMDVNRLFKRREVSQLCAEALQGGPMDTRALALYIIRKKGFDENDRHLKKAVAFRVVQALRLQEKRGGPIKRVGKHQNVVIWERS